MKLQVEYVPIGSIKPYENNAKLHPAAQVEGIQDSIETFGFNDPIAIWHGEIVAGHGRYEAARNLGLAEVPIIRLDDLTDEHIKAFRLADNKTAEFAEWDFEKLETELAELAEKGVNMENFGFDVFEGDQIPIIEEEDPEVFEVDEENEPITKRGQIWKLGEHYLMCGDATNEKDVEALMSAGEYPTSDS